jgi:hypothetical protein
VRDVEGDHAPAAAAHRDNATVRHSREARAAVGRDEDVADRDVPVDQVLLLGAVGHHPQLVHHRPRHVGKELESTAEVVLVIVGAAVIAVEEAGVEGVEHAVVGAGQRNAPPLGVLVHVVLVVVRPGLTRLHEAVVVEEHRIVGRAHGHRLRVEDVASARAGLAQRVLPADRGRQVVPDVADEVDDLLRLESVGWFG